MIKPGWIQTYTGRIFYPADPDPELICIEDIARGLALTCRFAGQSEQFYSVAQHCCLVSDHVIPENAFWGLMHDAAEAYLSDLASPVKDLLPDFRALEKKILSAIACRFQLIEEPPVEVLAVDRLMTATEADCLMKPTEELKETFNYPERISGLEIYPWPWQSAEAQFIMRAEGLISRHEKASQDVQSGMERGRSNA